MLNEAQARRYVFTRHPYGPRSKPMAERIPVHASFMLEAAKKAEAIQEDMLRTRETYHRCTLKFAGFEPCIPYYKCKICGGENAK